MTKACFDASVIEMLVYGSIIILYLPKIVVSDITTFHTISESDEFLHVNLVSFLPYND
jgi:hypothetical protein